MLRPFLLLFIILLSGIDAFAQSQFAFRISFTNKTPTPYSLSSPNAFLSSRAIARRLTQAIDIDSADLPLVQQYIDSTLKLTNGILHIRSRWQNSCVILLADTSNIALLRSQSFISQAQFIALFTSPLHTTVATTNKQPQTNKALRKTTAGIGYYGDAYDQIKIANGDYLHNKGLRGSGKLIAVLDAGFYLVNTLPGFDSLRLSGRILDTHNFDKDTSDVYGYSAHGTQVLSTMAGILNGNYVGTAPDASYALYITENTETEQPIELDNMLAAMERADSIGADIITISLGYNTFDIASMNLSYAQLDGRSTIASRAANTATAKGMLVVASAGNEGNTSWRHILTPGDADSALTCGSVDINKVIAITSGRGPNAADILKPDVCMMGAPGIVFNTSGTTSSVGGTSIAAPQLAGLAACLWQAQPLATPYQLRQAIRLSAHIATSPNNDLGYGLPNFAIAHSSLTLPTIDSYPMAPGIYCFPNPFDGPLQLRIAGTRPQGLIQWQLLDIQGRKITGNQLTDSSLYLSLALPLPSSLATGPYILQVSTAEYQQHFWLHKK